MFGKMELFWVKNTYYWRNMNGNYTDQTLNIGSIQHFFTRRESILLFLALTGVMAVLLVVFGNPTSLTSFTEQHTRLSLLGQIAICFTSCYGTLILSRLIMYFVGRKNTIQPAALVIWIIMETILCVSVMALVLWALSGGGKVLLSSLVGLLVLGFIGTLIVPYVITYLIFRLHETHEELLRLRNITDQQELAPQLTTDRNINFFAKGGRLAFTTKTSNLLYLESADNYVNIHYINSDHEDTFLLHNTLKNTERMLSGTSLIRCHRGYMVNVENVKLMRKESSGLVLELNQCAKIIPVSKSFADPVTQYFAYNTNMPLPNEN